MINKIDNRLLSWLSELDLIASDDFINGRTTKYFAFPDNNKTKLLIPLKISYRGYINALALYPSFTLSQKFKRNIAIGMNIFKPIVPGRFFIPVENSFFTKDLYQRISTQDKQKDHIQTCAIRIGSRGKGRKVILQFQDKDNQIISYVKVADSHYRGPYLESEKTTLEYLMKSCSDLFAVPRVIGLKKNASNWALELSPLTGFNYSSHINLEKIIDLYKKYVVRSGSPESSLDLKEEKKRLGHYVKTYSLIDWVMEHLKNVKDNMIIFSLTHRDMPAWNVLINKAGKVGILDWEFARFNHNPFQDPFHFLIHTELNNSKKSATFLLYKVLSNKNNKELIISFGKSIGVNDPRLIYSSLIYYLWDWYSLEQDNADKPDQGQEYLECLTWLKQNEDSNKYFV